jgi:hypothetical protein
LAWNPGALAQLGHPCRTLRFGIWDVCILSFVKVSRNADSDEGKGFLMFVRLTIGWVAIKASDSLNQGSFLQSFTNLFQSCLVRINNHHNKAAGFERRLEVGMSCPVSSFFTSFCSYTWLKTSHTRSKWIGKVDRFSLISGSLMIQ